MFAAEGSGEDDDEADNDMRLNAVEMYLELCDKPVLPSKSGIPSKRI